MIRAGIVVALVAILLSVPGGTVLGGTKSGIGPSLPAEVSGWQSAPGGQVVYNRESLYDYIDGGAELYLSYGFNRLESRTYVQDGEPDLVVDVFDMATSNNAFGVFSYSREVVDSTIGQGSQYTGGLLLFWKGRFYVSILASPETERSKRAVFELARSIESAIEDEGPLPDILSLLPRQGLVEESIRYFRHYIWLNSHYYVADENILHIDDSTEAVLAKYLSDSGAETGGSTRSILLVVRYPDEKAAVTAYRDFVQHYLPEKNENSAVRIEDGTWTACRINDDTIVVVFNAALEKDALSLIDGVVAEGKP